LSRFRVILEYDSANGFESVDSLKRHVEMQVNAGEHFDVFKVTHVVPLDPVAQEHIDAAIAAVRVSAKEFGVDVNGVRARQTDPYSLVDTVDVIIEVYTQLEKDAAFDFWEYLSNTVGAALDDSVKERVGVSVNWKY